MQICLQNSYFLVVYLFICKISNHITLRISLREKVLALITLFKVNII